MNQQLDELKRAIVREKRRECMEFACQAIRINKFPCCPFCPHYEVGEDEYRQCEG